MGKKKKELEIIDSNISVSVAKKKSDGDYGNNSIMLTHTIKTNGDITKKQRDEKYDNMFEDLNDKADELMGVFD